MVAGCSMREEAMKPARYQIAAMLFFAGMSIATAAPNIPSSELPGRERERFRESPLDRFTQPSPPAAPLYELPNAGRGCQIRPPRRSKQRSKRC
jgi:hypothetical protein